MGAWRRRKTLHSPSTTQRDHRELHHSVVPRPGDRNRASFQAKIEQMAGRSCDNEYRLEVANASPARAVAFCVAVEKVVWAKAVVSSSILTH
jgi:hypothetical protein